MHLRSASLYAPRACPSPKARIAQPIPVGTDPVDTVVDTVEAIGRSCDNHAAGKRGAGLDQHCGESSSLTRASHQNAFQLVVRDVSRVFLARFRQEAGRIGTKCADGMPS